MDFVIDDSWTLFLDRDGVINERIFGGYVCSPEEFHFLPQVPEAILEFRKHFKRIIIVTNQQCIGKNIVTKRNLREVHRYMQEQLMLNETHVDAVYFAPELASDPNNTRKPKPFMALEAQKDFPEIDFNKSWMVGDTDSDIKFGKNLGMKTARIVTEEPIGFEADFNFPSLFDLAIRMKKKMRKMQSKILLFVFVLLTNFAFNQNATDAKGRKQGPWQKAYPKSRALIYSGNFKDDKPVGKFVYYYPSTKVKAVIKHDETSNRAEAYYYHENGVLMSYGIYRDMKKDSIWYNYGPSGRISYTETYHNDVLNGEKVVYFVPEELADKSIRISAKMTYKDGKLDGEYREYFDVGTSRVKGFYVDNKREGTWEEFQPGGQLLSFSRYKNGLKHGWCTAHDEQGKEINRVYFYRGKMKTGKDLKLLMKQMKEKGINPNE